MKSLIVTALFLVSATASASKALPLDLLDPIVTANDGPFGGGGVVCRVNGKAVSTQVLDLWEAEAFKDISVTHSAESVKIQLDRALEKYARVNGFISYEIPYTAQSLFEQVELRKEGDVPPGLKLAPPSDMLSPFIPDPGSGCGFEGIASYDDTAQILFADQSLYTLLPNTDRAALFFHEAIYKYLRDHYGVTNSITARNITACTFADTPCPELSPYYGVPKTGPLYSCTPDGWTQAVQQSVNYNAEDRRMGQPHFYFFPQAQGQAQKPMVGHSVWRFQQLYVDLEESLLNVTENIPAKSFFDVQVDDPQSLKLEADGTVTNRILSTKGGADMTVSTMTSDASDPWKKSIGPQFSHRLKLVTTIKPQKTMLEIDGFPLKCQKVR